MNIHPTPPSTALFGMVVLAASCALLVSAQGWRDYTKVDLLCGGGRTQALCGTAIKTGYSVILATPVDPANGKFNCVNSRSPDKMCCAPRTAPLDSVDSTPVDLSTDAYSRNCEPKNDSTK
ncbi:hypothetical protein PTTG_10097 [Puccinia triticina 1-1 BBBD Race 1]|uniref:Hydrophobin n=2 Tax=Puccinia triticina TaxID=208348 RepID=A0A180GZD9_PUCT1|nr:uncharacterized protein PtA15_10A620 [Puccinia triticina]OAV97729.1 hypothetical protein PTTG_10097 [Puccinia triticina 1-1 BBBD Race 1]WAQ89196.1 hypothetical protein PtA15_10A620 [Puccinia triticina]WAR59249.1 hypothetical protein PtB15_10B591 [Puccinia triticina]